MQRRPCLLRNRLLQGKEAITQLQQRMTPKYNDRSLFGPLSPFGHRLWGVAQCRALTCAHEACDRRIAALTAKVVVALPRRTCPLVHSSSPKTGEHHQTIGSNTSRALKVRLSQICKISLKNIEINQLNLHSQNNH
ncbi:MAG: hypothetical protein ACJAVR_000894 [Paracoccaceae bacterium]|jgi:hypothetical protein